jgi:glucose-6-phosphate 1-dehydrogenase
MSFDLVLFGGTGDLAWRKLMPALFQAFSHGSLPKDGRIVGVARDDLSDDQYRELIQSRFNAVEGAKRPSAEEFEKFASLLHYLRMDLSKPADYARLADLLQQRNADTVVMYVATAPACSPGGASRLQRPASTGRPPAWCSKSRWATTWRRTARSTTRCATCLKKSRSFRIDHYLGKPSVQNLFAMRFGNALFEPIWRREHIANIQITIAEDLGVEKRGAFYDQTGALRDMVQNHALQLLCAIGMEPPINSHADAIRDEKLKVLRSLKPWTPETLGQHAMRGQYTAGTAYGEPCRATAKNPASTPRAAPRPSWRCAPKSPTGAGPACRFYIRTGKRLASRDAHIEVNFRPTPHAIFRAAGSPAPSTNW